MSVTLVLIGLLQLGRESIDGTLRPEQYDPYYFDVVACGIILETRGREALVRFDRAHKGWVLREEWVSLEMRPTDVGRRYLFSAKRDRLKL